MKRVEIRIDGRAAPKGSFKPIPNRKTGRTMLVPQNNKTLKAFQNECQKAMSQASMAFGDRPVRVTSNFYFKRTGPTTASSKDPAPVRVSGDLDKLNRSIFDELTKAGIIDDDKHVTSMMSTKRWSDGDAYCIVIVEEDPDV